MQALRPVAGRVEGSFDAWLLVPGNVGSSFLHSLRAVHPPFKETPPAQLRETLFEATGGRIRLGEFDFGEAFALQERAEANAIDLEFFPPLPRVS